MTYEPERATGLASAYCQHRRVLAKNMQSRHATGLRCSAAVVATFLLITSLTACRSEKDMLKAANCEGKVLTSREDGQSILELASDSIENFDSSLYESDNPGYVAKCFVRDAADKENPALVIQANYLTDDIDPRKISLRGLVGNFAVQGHLLRITSDAPHLGGASGEPGAVLRVPCAMSHSKTLPPDMREGAMTVAASSESAPDANSTQQRQNAADLALSFMRHAVQKCDDPPALPKSVHISK